MALPPSVRNGQSLAPETFYNLPNYNNTLRNNIIGRQHPSAAIDANEARNVLQRLQYPTDLPKYHTYIIESEVGSVAGALAGNGPRVLTSRKQYKLPLPSELKRDHDVMYDQDFNYLDMITKGVSAAALALQAVRNTIVQGIGSVVQGGAAAVANPNTRRAVGAVTGLAINNFKAVTLDVPRFQNFTLAWKFSPKSYDESAAIQQIITSIQKGMHPGGLGPQVFGTYAAFSFPRVYSVGIVPNSKFLMKFKPAVIQSIQVDYQAANPTPAFYAPPSDTGENLSDAHSPPESVIVSMNFLELEYWLSQDFPDGLPSDNPFISNYYTYSVPNQPRPPLPPLDSDPNRPPIFGP